MKPLLMTISTKGTLKNMVLNECETSNWRAPRHRLMDGAYIKEYKKRFPISQAEEAGMRVTSSSGIPANDVLHRAHESSGSHPVLQTTQVSWRLTRGKALGYEPRGTRTSTRVGPLDHHH